MKGVLYVRYSDGPNQNEQSIEGQISDCMSYAEKNDIKIIKVYADKHVSGKSTAGRDEFLQMMEDAKKKIFDCVIVWKIDRFGRNRQDIAFNKYKLKKCGVKLLYAAESIPDTPEGIILESVMEGLAEYYSADLSQKVKRGIRESAKKGQVPWHYMPIGYYKVEDKQIHIEEKSAAAVKTAFNMYVEGAQLKDITNMFAERGILSRRGAEISNSVLYRMFRNESYLGEIDVMGVKVKIDPIIDEEMFNLAQVRCHNTRSRNASSKAKTNYLLSGKCFCGYCGSMMMGESGTGKYGKTYHYYKCGKKKRGEGKCKLDTFKKEYLEKLVIQTTINDVLQDGVLKRLVKEIMRIQDEEKKYDPAAVIKRKIDKNKKKQENLLSAIEESGSKAIADRLSVLENEERTLKIELNKLEIEDTYVPEEAIWFWLNHFKNGDIENEEFCQQIMDTFVSRVEVKNDEITIHYNIDGLCSDVSASESPSSAESTAFERGSNATPSMDQTGPYSNTVFPFNKPLIFNNQIVIRIAI